MSKVYILPYLRKGLATNLTGPDKIEPGQQRARIDVTLGFDLKQVATDQTVHRNLQGQTIELLGPADVQSVNKRAISRLSPASGGGVQLNRTYMPYVEFYEEDLPWRYTPLSPSHRDFHPWMALIAVKTDEVKVYAERGVKVAHLTLTPERYAQVFPTAEQLSRVGHVQIDVTSDRLDALLSDRSISAPQVEAEVNAMLDLNPDCGVSRILSTSRLEASTRYTALLIPTYELGRRAALGLSTDGVGMTDRAWADSHDGSELVFPVYERWTFETAVAEDNFNVLADRLFFTSDDEYAQLKAYLDVDISDCGLPTYRFDKETVIDVPAALIANPTAAMPDKVRHEDEKRFTPRLQDHLSLNPVFDENAQGGTISDEDPWVVPPVYGARHMLTTRQEFIGSKGYNLVADVNLRLRNRIAAGMGSSVVKANQEEFVNRAWKKVEVVNSLNQLLREYYQMHQVNQRAKDKNVRQSVRSEHATVNKDTEGLLYDAALRMLQTSGIYYNNVAPDTMLAEAGKMIVAPQPIVMRGLPANYLLSLYDQDVWREFIAKEMRYDYVYDNTRNLLWQSDTFEPWNFLEHYFSIEWSDDRRPYFRIPAESNRLTITPNSLLSHRFNDLTDLRDLFEKCDHMDCNTIYNALAFIRDLKPTFDATSYAVKHSFCRQTNGSEPRDYTLHVYPIRAKVPYTAVQAFIVNDADYNLLQPDGRPLAVEYYVGTSKSTANRRYIVFIPRKYADSHAPRYAVDCRKSVLGFEIEVRQDAQGKWYSTDITLPNFDKDYGCKTWFYNQVLVQRDWHRAHGGMWTSTHTKSGKKYESKKENPCLQIQYNSTKFETSLKGKEHQWLRWVSNDPLSLQFWTWRNEDKSFTLNSGAYRSVLTEILELIDSLTPLTYQPTDVDVRTFSMSDCRILRAEELYDDTMANTDTQDDVTPDLNRILQAVANEESNISKDLDQKLKERPEVDDSVQLNLPDPDALGRERIEDLCHQYGVTEANQLKLSERLHARYPVMVYPDFLDPTFYYLRELTPDYVLPATGSLLKNTITTFYSNPAFEEAFLLGMNTEMGRELLWREYPTDQRGSYFRKFWDQTTLPDKERLDTEWYDVKHLDLWNSKKSNGNPTKLGENHMPGKGQMLVFAIKGELMQAFPDTDVYLQTPDGKKTLTPSMTSWLTSDTYLVGFQGVTREQLPAYMLTFRQKPLSLQFSMDSRQVNDLCRIVRPCCYRVPAGQLTK